MCSRAPSARDIRRWANMFRALCSRGLGTSYSLQTAFEHIYVQQTDEMEEQQAARNAFQDRVHGIQAAADANQSWFQPGGWPLPLTLGIFAGSSEVAAALRDCSVFLFWLARLSSSGAAAVSDLASLGASGIGAAVVIPGPQLGNLLLGHDHGPLRAQDANDSTSRAKSWAMLTAAMHVYLERSAAHAHYSMWALACLEQCRAVAALTQQPVASHIDDAAEVVRAFSAHALCEDGAMGARLMEAVSVAVLLQRAAKQGGVSMKEAASTLLQLSQWRHANPRNRSKLPATHPALDWLWPLFIAAQALEEWLLAPECPFAWSTVIDEKVRNGPLEMR